MSLYSIVFSPTGGTKKVADIVCEALGPVEKELDLTDRAWDTTNLSLSADDVAVISVPSYNGRVPVLAATRLMKIKGEGARAILVCVYGNRAFEDTLIELRDSTTTMGFAPVAAIAAIAEHSIAHQFATGRPDDSDEATLLTFIPKIKEKLAKPFDGSVLEVPGNQPYKSASGPSMVPKTTRACTKCGTCAKECPTGAIDPEDPKKTDSKKCISCMRCVTRCPQHARKLNSALQFAVGAMLKGACSERKNCELFL